VTQIVPRHIREVQLGEQPSALVAHAEFGEVLQGPTPDRVNHGWRIRHAWEDHRSHVALDPLEEEATDSAEQTAEIQRVAARLRERQPALEVLDFVSVP